MKDSDQRQEATRRWSANPQNRPASHPRLPLMAISPVSLTLFSYIEKGLQKMNQPIIPWVGGKRRLAKNILPLFPEHQCYVEPFCGGAALYFIKEPVKAEVLNDINGELVNLYRVVKHHLEEFVRQFKWALTSRQLFHWLQITPEETLTDIQRAARFYYLQKLAWSLD